MKCPNCGLLSPVESRRCECGYDFEAKSLNLSDADRARIAEIANTRLTTWVVLVVAAVITLGILIYAAQPGEQSAALGWAILAFSIWPLSPYAGLALIAFRSAPTIRVSFSVLVNSSIISVLGIASLIYAMFLHLHSTSGLIFFSLPVLQWVGCVVTWIIASAAGTPKRL
jgi:hypothetical protein